MRSNLPSPPRYKPWTKGVYEVAPGLKSLGTDYGNGDSDGKLFQFDTDYSRYLENKHRCLEERKGKYVMREKLSPSVEAAVVELMAERLVKEWPELFTRIGETLQCELTGQTIPLALDQLMLQVQEDLAVVVISEGQDWIGYLNICCPSHWIAETKIGRSFFETHIPIPGFERVNAVAHTMALSMVHKGPFVRFVWGLTADDRLNQHPEPPPGIPVEEWDTRKSPGAMTIRVERQTTWGLPEVGAAIFAIRVGFTEGEEVRKVPEEWKALQATVRSMSAESQAYKGLAGFLPILDI